jgi:multidrug efflux pump subunit AcrB
MAIFYVSEYTELRQTLAPRWALRQASRNRLRPITVFACRPNHDQH